MNKSLSKPQPTLHNLRRFFGRLGLMVFVILLFIIGFITYTFTPKTTRVGYCPDQPIPFSHKIHAGELGLSCISCHPYSSLSKQAGIVDQSSCLACHKQLQPESAALSPLMVQKRKQAPSLSTTFAHQASFAWRRVYALPDYVSFNHSAHVNRGVGCISCHGDVTTMDRIRVVSDMSMAWCLKCHRNPTPNLRPIEEIESSTYSAETFLQNHPLPQNAALSSPANLGSFLQKQWKIHPGTDCTTCHH